MTANVSVRRLTRARRGSGLGVCLMLGLTLPVLAPPAVVRAADQQAARYRFKIPAQPLDTALLAFSSQTKVQVLMWAGTGAEIRSPGVEGELSLAQALRALLGDTGLGFQQIDADTVAIVAGKSPAAGQVTSSSQPTPESAGTQLRTAAGPGPAEPSDAALPGQELAPAAAAGNLGVEEVIVTGSHIARPAFDMPTPLTVIDSEQIRRSGFNNIADLLTQLPEVGLGFGLSTGQFSDDAGAAFANLRGLGTARTLVLVNGRRKVAGSSDSAAVDLSTIPASLIERVEIITGGASAVYGADAVSGVINVILKKDFSGLELSGQGGFSQDGGAGSASATILGGGSLDGGRGSFSLALSHVRDEPLFSNERWFTRRWLGSIPNPANTGPADGIPDMITVNDFAIGFLHPGGVFNIDGIDYTVDPQLRPLRVDAQTGLPFGGDGWDFSRYFQQRLRAETTTVRGNLNYRLNDSVELVLESDFTHGTAFGGGAPNYDLGDAVLYRDNPFLPAALGAMMDASGLDSLSVSRASVDQGIRNDDNSRNSFSVLTGLQGHFGGDWQWQAFAQYGRYELRSRELNQRITSRYLEAIDVIADPVSGDPVCRSEAARAAGCRALNILGQNVATDEAMAYFRVNRTLQVENTQTLAGAQLTGNLLELPGGALASAAGFEYRRDTRVYRDDPLAELGLLSDKAAGTSLAGDDTVSEAFLELVAPLLRDRPFAHDLRLEGAVRWSQYESIGDTTAWKLGGSWSPVAGLRVRATRSRSVRAPSLYELYMPRQISQISIYDPCQASQIASQPNRAANCRALGIPEGWVGPRDSGDFYLFDTVGGGNQALEAETSDAWTAGLVISPPAVPGLSIALDYWRIEIAGAVQALDVTSIVQRCVDSGSIDNVFCPRVERGADHGITLVDYSIINVGSLSTDGVDLQASYSFDAGRLGWPFPGRFTLGANATYLHSLEQLVDSGDPSSLLVQSGRYDNPRWRGTVSLGYQQQAFRAALNLRVIGKARVDMQSSLETYDRPRVPARIYTDLALGYEFGTRYDVRLTVNNLFYTTPPMTEYTYLGGNSSLYDSIGRYFVLGVSAKL